MPVSFDSVDKENVVPTSHHPHLLPSSSSSFSHQAPHKPSRSVSPLPLKPSPSLPPSIKPSPLATRLVTLYPSPQPSPSVSTRIVRPSLVRFGTNRLAGAQRVTAMEVREDSSDDEDDDDRPTKSSCTPPPTPPPPPPPPAPAAITPPPPATFSPTVDSNPTPNPNPPPAPLPPPASTHLPPPSLPTPSASPSPSPTPSSSSTPSPAPSPAAPSLPTSAFHLGGTSYFPISLIGRGATSSVYKVLSSSKQLFALKVISLSASPSALLSLHTEVECMQRLRHSPHAIHLHHHSRAADAFFLLLELGSTDLASFIHAVHAPPQPSPLHPIRLRQLWLGILQCVDECHRVGILHRDLKPANFVFVDGNVKIIDFGIAKVMGEGDAGATAVISPHLTGTINYMSPESLEAIDGSGEAFRQNRKSDVWSLGCILYQMVYGRCPFAEVVGVLQKMRAIGDVRWKIKFDEEVGEGKARRAVGQQCLDVMRRCLERNVNQRASIEELLNHPYLNPD